MSDTRAPTGPSSRLVAGVVFLATVCPAAAGAEVLFENPGNVQGWGRVFTQKAGTITEVAAPVYKGTTAVKTTQTYQSSDGKNYHSEIIKNQAHLAGQDLYYGHAVYLPADWVFHGQNVTFQQWAPEVPEAPWILMFLQGEKVRLGGRGANGDKDAGSVTGLRGTWIRFVTRIHMATDGAFEVWINGQKTFSQRGNFRAHGPSMRWSNGIYCTRWDTETPTGPRELTLWHDNLRIATTYAEADPATWGDGEPSRPDGGADGAAASDASGSSTADGGSGAGGSGGSGGIGGSGGSMGAGTGGSTTAPPSSGRGTGGRSAGTATGGSPGAAPSPPPPPAGQGCRFGGAGGVGPVSVPWLALLLAVLLLRRRARS